MLLSLTPPPTCEDAGPWQLVELRLAVHFHVYTYTRAWTAARRKGGERGF